MGNRVLSMAPRFFLAIVCSLGHQASVPQKRSKSPDDTSERLTALYNQFQGVMPLLQDIVQPGEIKEGEALSTPSSSLSPNAGRRYQFEKREKESWAMLDRRQGDALSKRMPVTDPLSLLHRERLSAGVCLMRGSCTRTQRIIPAGVNRVN